MARPLIGAFMTTTFPTLSPQTPILAAVDFFVEHGILGAPVVDDDGLLVGFFSEVDCMRLLAVGDDHDVPAGRVADHMVREVRTAPPGMDVHFAAGLMLAAGFSYLPVVENGVMVGLINRRALLKALKEHFEREMMTD